MGRVAYAAERSQFKFTQQPFAQLTQELKQVAQP
jgi:hypothetical protein